MSRIIFVIMTNLTLKTKLSSNTEIKNYVQTKLKELAFRYPIILKSDIVIELNDEEKRAQKECTIKLKSQQSKFVVVSHSNQCKRAIDECIIILNYQLTVMS